MKSQVGQSLASLKMNFKGSSEIGNLRQKLKINCNKPVNAVPCDPFGKVPCLFNIAADPCEYNNLASKMPKKVDELLGLLEEYRAVAVKLWNLDPSVLNDSRSTPLFCEPSALG